jgi:hypothetical protein
MTLCSRVVLSRCHRQTCFFPSEAREVLTTPSKGVRVPGQDVSPISSVVTWFSWKSRGRTVGIVTRLYIGWPRPFSSTEFPYGLWGPSSVLFSGHRGLFSSGQSGWNVKLSSPFSSEAFESGIVRVTKWHLFTVNTTLFILMVIKKATPLQAWTGPQVSRRSRLPDF